MEKQARRRSSRIRSIALAALLVAAFVGGRVWADQPHMQAALAHLRNARAELDRALADKGGHRVKALSLVNDAIAEIERGIEYDRRH